MRGIIISLFFISTLISFSQSRQDESIDSVQLEFLKHLKKERLWEEGLHFLKPFSSTDQTNYYRGIFHYNLEVIDSSVFFLSNVKSNSIYWDQSRLLSSFQLAYQGDLEKSQNILRAYQPTGELLSSVLNFQKGGIDLLNRNLAGFEDHESSFGQFYQLAPYEKELILGKQRINDLKHKSPFAAGLLSAIVPGAGRFYIGKPGEGVATLLVTGIFALQSMEAYRKDGPKSARFILFTSLLSITYVSNIWGSVFSVKVANLEKNKQINEDILLNMHIPLRVIFD